MTEERTEYIDERPGYVRESETTYVDDDYQRRQEYGYERRDEDYSYSARVDERVDYRDDRIEERVDYRDDSFTDDAARWAGRQEERVEDFPDNAAR